MSCEHKLKPSHRWADCIKCDESYSVYDLINLLKTKDAEIEVFEKRYNDLDQRFRKLYKHRSISPLFIDEGSDA